VRRIWASFFALSICAGSLLAKAAAAPGRAVAQQAATAANPSDLAAASSGDLLKVYAQLRSLQGSDVTAVAENVVWKRDSATITFKDGRLTFAAPVAGRVVAAVFSGQATFELDPPSAIDRNQIARFTKEPKLEESFREAVFFFTDNSWQELQHLMNVRPGGDAAAASKALEATQRRFSDEYNWWWANMSNGRPGLRNHAARMLADLTDPSSRGWFLADINSDHYNELLFEISWNRDSALGPAWLSAGEEVKLVRFKHSQAFEWWSGFHLKDEYANNPHPDHRTLLVHCSDEHIDATVTQTRHISETATLQFEVPAASARVLPMNLDNVLRVSEVTDGAGKKIDFIQEDRKHDGDLWVILPEAAKPGANYTLKISYDEDSTLESRIIQIQGSGLYLVNARSSWYPSFEPGEDLTHFTLDFHSPKKYTLIATGRLMSSDKGHDELETKWDSEIPYRVVGFNYGDFVNKSESDASVTLTAYAGRELPDEIKSMTNQMDMQETQYQHGNGSSVETQWEKMRGGFNTAGLAQREADLSYQAFKLFRYYFGPLPFKFISVTEQPVGDYGQSWPTLVFLPYHSFLDKTTLNSLSLQTSAEDRQFLDTVAMHEVSHQWWGHTVGWKSYHDQWLSEGFADFSAALFLKQSDPKRLRGFWDLQRKWILNKNAGGVRPTDAGPIWLNSQTNSYVEGDNASVLIYRKGSYVLEMLRAIMEDPRQHDPDQAFIDMMRDFVSTYAGKNASTQDFQSVVEKHVGRPMDWFFNEWVYGTAVPHYDFDYGLKDAGGGKSILHVRLRQSEVPDDFMMAVPLYFSMGGSTRRLAIVPIKGSSTFEQDIPLPIHPDKVWMDEYHSILNK